ncbi:MAG: ribonuclease HII [Calditrichaceae bacterium]
MSEGTNFTKAGELKFDQPIWDSGIKWLCGVDEAGRGPLAGPVISAAVILPAGCGIPGADDSKKVSEKDRLRLEGEIKSKAVSWGIGSATVDEINSLNILQATFLAMKRAVNELNVKPQYILIDGRDFPAIFYRKDAGSLRGQSVIKGDEQSLSIACASILAKVHRDRLMCEYAKKYPEYHFERHKGYGTSEHRRNILEYGPSPLHRKIFLRKLLNKEIRQYHEESSLFDGFYGGGEK